jgi:DNA (cytosine-5)-methyltransferase 1
MLNQPESWFHPVLMRQREGKDGGGKGPLISEEKSLTLATSNDQVLMQPVASFLPGQGSKAKGIGYEEEIAPTLTAGCDRYGLLQPNNDQVLMQQVAPALTASNDPSRSPQSSEVTQQVLAVMKALMHTMQVRRLTPVECERLQGFPDNFTRIPWKRKPADDCPDGPRYKALGNSMAVPCMRWIGERINKQAHDNN